MSVPSFPIGTRYLPNNITVMLQKYAGRLFASNHISLNGTTQSVPYPVLHDLGSDILNTVAPTVTNDDETTTFTGYTNNDFDLAVTVVGTNTERPFVGTNGTIPTIGSVYKVSFDVVVNSGTVELTSVHLGGATAVGFTDTTLISGTYSFDLEATATGTSTRLLFNGTNLFDISVTNWTVKEITLPTASYLTILQADGTIKQLSSTGDVGENLVSNGDFSNGTTGLSIIQPEASVVNEELVIEHTGSTASSLFRISTAEIGTRYNASVEYKDGTTDPRFLVYDDATIVYNVSESSVSFIKKDYSFTATNTTVDLKFQTNLTGTSLYDNARLTEVLPISTTYSETASHQFVFNHTSPLTADDITELERDPNLIFRVWFNAEVLPSGFAKADIGNFFGGNEGLASGAYIQDLSVDLSGTILDATAPTYTAGDETATFSSSVDNSFDLAITVAGTNTTKPRISSGATVASASKLYVFTLELVLNSGSGFIQAINNAGTFVAGSNLHPSSVLATGTYTYIGYGTEGSTVNRVQFNGTSLFDVSVTKWEVREATAVEIDLYDTATRTTLANQSSGATGLKLIQDGSGRTTGTAPANTLSHTSDGHADTEWLPNISKYTIKETITGNLAILDVAGVPTGSFSVRTEARVLTHEEGIADNLYIDTVLQPYTPSLPNPLETVKLGQTAVIGYADTITSRSDGFSVKAIVSVP